MKNQLGDLLSRHGISDFQRCVLIVGAGLSSRGVLPDGTGLPNWPSLTKLMVEDLSLLNRIDSRKHKNLQQMLARDEAASYLKIASVYKELTDAAEFDSFFRRQIDPFSLRPATIHEQIIRIGFRAIVTTNFDRLFELASPTLATYAYPDCLGRGDILQSAETFLLKIHGSVAPSINLKSRLIISRGDYNDARHDPTYQQMLKTVIAGNPVIAVGYSCRDPDFFQVMADLRDTHLVGPFIYALLKEPNADTMEMLRDANIKVLPYCDHAELPEFFDSLPIVNSPVGANDETVQNTKPRRRSEISIARGLPRSRSGSISSGALSIDLALGTGGWPRGHVVEIFGPSSAGKTTLVLHALAEAQLAGGAGALIDADHATDPFVAERIGVDIDRLYYMRPEAIEDAWAALDRLVSDNLVDVIALDSIAALLPRARLCESHFHGSTRDIDHRSIIIEALQKLMSKLSNRRAIILITNHIFVDPGVMFGNPERQPWPTEPLAYYASVRIDVRRIAALADKDKVVGYQCRVSVLKNRFAAPVKAECDILFESGISKAADILDVAVTKGIIEKTNRAFVYKKRTLGAARRTAINVLAKRPRLYQEVKDAILNDS